MSRRDATRDALEARAVELQFKDGPLTAADVAELERIAAKLSRPPYSTIRKPRRPNPPANGVRRAKLHGLTGTLVAVGLDSISYRHAQSKSRALYTHDFDGTEQLWAMSDGSLVIRHPRSRLWSDFTVGDDE